ncbi:MAG: biotin--[acetyl-CoA-carboxylase] ligase [Candidatus Rokubacteria bacterium]|nr:biotin--[acetyl-CoA-carboxylase] ligase [Candidatus Rokubacteria bacterium]
MTQAADVRGAWAGRAVHRLGEVDSTQNEARRLADEGVPEGTVVWAEHQTRGRGRLGRSWVDEPAASLLISIILRPALDASRLPQISLLAGVAVADALAGESELPVTLSWPNDLLIRGRKVAGILAESCLTKGAPGVVILGIGINVNQTHFSGELGGRATSLAMEAGHPFDRARVLRLLLERLEAWYRWWVADGFQPVREAWRHRAETLGRRIDGDGGVAGVAVDLADDGALVVKTDSGALVRLHAGDFYAPRR